MPYQAYATGSTPGVQGDTTINTANGVRATSNAGASALYATVSGNGAAVHGYVSGGYGNSSWAVYGSNANVYGYGVFGAANSSQGIGVYGEGDWSGVYGYGTDGVIGSASASNGAAIYGYGNASSTAGLFSGNVSVVGSFSASSKSFLIDHPKDPSNRFLEHACVESPERKTIYDGCSVADDSGVLEVALPGYFEALNGDVRYQLSAVGAPAPDLHIRSEVNGGKFVIAGARPGQKVCWQVTGVRRDAYASAHPILVERDKLGPENGLYLHPAEHGQPSDKGIHHAREQRVRERLSQRGRPPGEGP